MMIYEVLFYLLWIVYMILEYCGEVYSVWFWIKGVCLKYGIKMRMMRVLIDWVDGINVI